VTEAALDVWTVYRDPRDFPGKWVARLHRVTAGVSTPSSVHFVADTLDGVRALLPPGLFRLDRFELDEPHVYETWF
jgi:hypothetical protein